jgi:hypothetical protein
MLCFDIESRYNIDLSILSQEQLLRQVSTVLELKSSQQSRLLEEQSLATNLQGVYFIFYIFLPLHVSALAGHLQAEYTIILGSYFTHNGPFVVCN